jgi:hypothetical protein
MQILYINRQKRKTAGQESTELIAVCHHFGGTKAGVAQKPEWHKSLMKKPCRPANSGINYNNAEVCIETIVHCDN